MNDKWIGEITDISGSYYATSCEELYKRYGGRIDSNTLYKFESRFGEKYYITDEEVIRTIEGFLTNNDDSSELYEYLYQLIIKRFGIIEFIHRVELKIAEERDIGFKAGITQHQKQIKKLLGIGEFLEQ